ncbi:MAG: AI-2E family transporter [Anaerolineaceae bacterium]|jgi:predicted PurR-regulated permease PerM|nr:AI-2E family transporter [Anaerolineaceae bacterium]MDD4043498.1 AI-2E family transporter [Anaerolineaceae bacterium]MDD4577243.1 AI-2E family transporter [Anaerolineaceae bacterium]
MKQVVREARFKDALISVLLFLLVVAAFYGIYRFHHILFTLFVAIIFGTMVRVPHQWMVNKGVHKNIASVIMLVGILALLVGFLLLLLPVLTSQYQTLLSAIPRYYSTLRNWLEGSRNELVARLSQALPASLNLQEPLPNAEKDAITTLNTAMRFLGGGINTIFILVVSLSLAYQWMISGSKIIVSSLFFLKPDKRQEVFDIIKEIEAKLTQYLVGQGILSLSIFAISLVAFLLLRLPNAFLLALIAGLFEAVPMVGPVLGAIPAILVALSMSPTTVVLVIISAVLIQQIENNLLVPRVMNKVLGINPFISILSIAAFTSLYGIGGAFMAIPLAAVIQLIFDRTFLQREPTVGGIDGIRDKLNLLRYDTQKFITDMRSQSRQSQPGDTAARARIDTVMEEMEMVARDLDLLLAEKAQEKNGK